ncbi:MAG: UDP-N-acetylmuramoyl-tripeptide--D-alanyl-D-alanine ligase [Ruminococcaceae bacterium]|jgi:UDP-N-acetylmuramoyl-tripeptide--D-alanyl-D-alanine ligase|nr:UDP-N-acetylmuramoyl-tripeptide--D-alanyl-D-alanine ligase [Oscillospiraceae bacterium]
MFACTLAEICAAVGGTLLQECGGTITSVGTDSRKAAAGQLFIPLVGERFDGHDYLESALSGGAEACLTARRPERLLSGKGYILVADTMLALKALSTWYREKFEIPFVQVTGSAGKTTTKEMIAAVLGRRFRVHKTRENLNNLIGTPLTLLELEEQHEAAVIETGMDHFGQIRYMGQMVQPDFAVITNVGDAHAENLGSSRQGVLRAKSEIFENLQPGGIAVLNGDDELLRKIALRKETLFCGRGANCQVRVSRVEELGLEGLRCTVTTGWDTYDVRVAAPGAYMIYPAAMAIAIGERLGLTKDEMLSGILDYRPVGSRMHLIRLPEDRLIIDDCYNANPQSMAEALHLLAGTPCRHRLAVLGDMNELGELSISAHRRVGELTKELKIDTIIAIGDKAKYMTETAEKGIYWYPDIAGAMETLRSQFTPGTAALVKASHSMAFERIVAELEKQ